MKTAYKAKIKRCLKKKKNTVTKVENKMRHSWIQNIHVRYLRGKMPMRYQNTRSSSRAYSSPNSTATLAAQHNQGPRKASGMGKLLPYLDNINFPCVGLAPLSSPSINRTQKMGQRTLDSALEAGGTTKWRSLGSWIFVNLRSTELLQEQSTNLKCFKSMRFWGGWNSG